MSDYENVNTTPDYENVKADYTPTTDRVRNSYANDIASYPKPENIFEANARAEAAKEDFDEWFSDQQGDAFFEGMRAGIKYSQECYGEQRPMYLIAPPLNPYREVSK